MGDDDQSHLRLARRHLDNLKAAAAGPSPAAGHQAGHRFTAPTSAILRAANNVIGPNPKLFENAVGELGEGEPVRVVDADGEEHEAERAARIQACAGQPTAGLGSFAILYRANHQAKPFEEGAARRANIPYKGVRRPPSFFRPRGNRDLHHRLVPAVVNQG